MSSFNSTRMELNQKCTQSKQCKNVIENSDCFFNRCKCIVNFGPSIDRRKCRKSKKPGFNCSTPYDTCFSDALECHPELRVCVCAFGFRYDSKMNECYSAMLSENCSLNELIAKDPKCNRKNLDVLLPGGHQRPRLSVLTFFVLIVCCMIILRKSSNQNNIATQNRRRSRNSPTNPLSGSQSGDFLQRRTGWRSMVRYATNDDFNNTTSFQENSPPPAYDEIFPNVPPNPNVTSTTSSDTSSAQKSTDSDSGQNSDQSQDRNNNSNTSVITNQQVDANSIRIDIPFEQISPVPNSPGGAVSITHPALLNRTNDEELKPPNYFDAINMRPI